jgi:hypothetical protein
VVLFNIGFLYLTSRDPHAVDGIADNISWAF